MTCYVGLCPVCSKVVAATIAETDERKAEARATIGGWIINGLKFEEHESGEAVHRIGWCDDSEGHIPVWIDSDEAS